MVQEYLFVCTRDLIGLPDGLQLVAYLHLICEPEMIGFTRAVLRQQIHRLDDSVYKYLNEIKE